MHRSDQDAVTGYVWDRKWERVTKITFPEQNVLRFPYDDTTPGRHPGPPP